MEKINIPAIEELFVWLKNHTGQKFKYRIVSGYTEVPQDYRESADWQTWAIAAHAIVNSGLEEVPNYMFWKLLAESQIRFIFCHKSGDLSDLVILQNPKIHIQAGPNGMRLHNLSGPAIEWQDGVKVYAAEGILMDSIFYENPDAVTTLPENLEKRRLALHIMGAENFFARIGKGEILDSGMDRQGNLMELFEFYDPVLGKNLKVLKVICPSTQRKYFLYPPNQEVKDVFSAKASTFRNERLAYRQGDVGLKFIDRENPEFPYLET
jgi:hypothetical protein